MEITELRSILKGTIIPVTTPFKADLEIDYNALEILMDFYLHNGIRCFIAAGSTGQGYVLNEKEHQEVLRTIINACKEYTGCFILGACSHTSTAVSNRLADICQREGTDALLMTPPYYNTHRDMCIIHYTDVVRNHDIPLFIYHNRYMPEDLTMWDEILNEPKILGVKYATGNIDFARKILARYKKRLLLFGGGGMLLYLQILLHGASGYVSSYASFMPEIEKDFLKFIDEGYYYKAAKIAELEYDLFECMGNRSWFSFIVGMINACGLPGGFCRPPLLNCTNEDHIIFKNFIADIKAKHRTILDEINRGE